MSYAFSGFSIGTRALAILSAVVGEGFFLDVDVAVEVEACGVDPDVEACGVDLEARALSAISC